MIAARSTPSACSTCCGEGSAVAIVWRRPSVGLKVIFLDVMRDLTAVVSAGLGTLEPTHG